jgi:hypothetical protein
MLIKNKTIYRESKINQFRLWLAKKILGVDALIAGNHLTIDGTTTNVSWADSVCFKNSSKVGNSVFYCRILPSDITPEILTS